MYNAENGHACPSDDFSSEVVVIVKRCLENAGFSETDIEWLIDFLKWRGWFGNDSETSFNSMLSDYFSCKDLQWIVEELGEPIQAEEDRQTRLALLFGFLIYFSLHNEFAERINEIHNQPPSLSLDCLGWIGEFREHAGFSAEYLNFCKLDRVRKRPCLNFGDLIPFLFPEGVPLNHVVDLGMLSPRDPILRSNRNYDNPKQLEFWLTCRLSRRAVLIWNPPHPRIAKLDTLLPTFSDPDFPDDILGEKIIGLLHAISEGMLFDSKWLLAQGLDPLNTAWRLVAHELIPFFKLLDEKAPEESHERSYLLKAWWHLSRVIYDSRMGGLNDELSQELRDRLVESAARHIGILRSVLRDSPEDFDEEDSYGIPVFDFYIEAFEVLLAFAKPWKRLKPLLLVFSAMKRPAVASDLRTWPEFEKEPLPDPYFRIARRIAIGMYPEHLQEELKHDPYLQGLREEFAKFCLERLRTRKERREKSKDSNYTDEDFVETRPVWRRGYVQALAALRVNPGGRAHRTLFWLLNNDPDKRVRELAKKAHKQVRHLDRDKPNLDEGASPRRPLFEAFWRLREAHLKTLGIKIDHEGAKRTRQTELRRTREKDER